jgi:membrane associated rhomboid family serine protease
MNRSLTKPHVNRILIMVNVIVFLVMFLHDIGFIESNFVANIGENFAMYPYYIVRGEKLYTLFTSMFLNAEWLHLIFNMLFLYVFGDNIEDIFGHLKYLIFYLFCGLAASFTYIISLPSVNPMESVVGASGAISGVLGAYLVLFPKAKILTIVFYGWVLFLPIPAIIFLGIWFATQWLSVFFEIGGNIAWWAHIGGFIAGMIVALAFGLKRKKTQQAHQRS